MEYKSKNTLDKIKSISKDISYKSEKRRLLVYKDKITCKPGCSHCCSRPVFATIGEVANISDSLKKSGKLGEVIKRSEELMEYGDIPLNTWYDLQLKCPVLDPETNKCLAYQNRPLMCSTHFSESVPDLCNPQSFVDGELKLIEFEDYMEEGDEKIIKVSGQSYWKSKIILHYVISNVDVFKNRDGLQSEEIVSMIAKGY